MKARVIANPVHPRGRGEQVLDALSGAKVDLSSGNWVQVVVGGAMLCLSLAMIYHQYRQHRDGVA